MMNWSSLYKVFLGVGVLIMVASLFFPVGWIFAMLLLSGVFIAIFALIEMVLLKRERQKTQKPAQKAMPSFAQQSDISYQEAPGYSKAVSYAKPSLSPAKAQPEQPAGSWRALLSRFFPKHEKPEEVHVAEIKGIKQPLKKQKKIRQEDINVIKESLPEGQPKDKLTLLERYITDAVRKGFPKEKIKEAALQAHWPKDLFEETYGAIIRKGKKKKLLVAAIVFVANLLYIALLHAQDMFLVPYWIKTLKYASPLFYVGTLFVVVAVGILFSFKLKKTLKRKKAEYLVEEEEHVQEIKSALQSFEAAYETDLDKVYALLEKKKVLRVNEIARAFGISKKEAEEWGKILQEQNLAEAYYPTVGDMEIRWKKSKSIASL